MWFDISCCSTHTEGLNMNLKLFNVEQAWLKYRWATWAYNNNIINCDLYIGQSKFITITVTIHCTLKVKSPSLSMLFLSDLLRALESCLTTTTALPFLLDVVFNIKEWLSPHANHHHSHTQPKCWEKWPGNCVMFYRYYSTKYESHSSFSRCDFVNWKCLCGFIHVCCV